MSDIITYFITLSSIGFGVWVGRGCVIPSLRINTPHRREPVNFDEDPYSGVLPYSGPPPPAVPAVSHQIFGDDFEKDIKRADAFENARRRMSESGGADYPSWMTKGIEIEEREFEFD